MDTRPRRNSSRLTSCFSNEMRSLISSAHLYGLPAQFPFYMAPLAGFSDKAWRTMALLGGAAATYTEMISVTGLHYNSQKSKRLIEAAPFEDKLIVQLFGHDPYLFAESATFVQEMLGDTLAGIDINMACPVPKVIKKGDGAALAENTDEAALCCRAVKQAVGEGVPLSVKMRLGMTPQRSSAQRLIAALEEVQVDKVCIHGRYATELYHGTARTDEVLALATSTSIPTLLSGDVFSPERAAECLLLPNISGVLCARGTYGNPWIFSDASKIVRGESVAPHTIDERLDAFELHMRLMDLYGSERGRYRAVALHYIKGFEGAAKFREKIALCHALSDYLLLIEEIKTSLQCLGEKEGPQDLDIAQSKA